MNFKYTWLDCSRKTNSDIARYEFNIESNENKANVTFYFCNEMIENTDIDMTVEELDEFRYEINNAKLHSLNSDYRDLDMILDGEEWKIEYDNITVRGDVYGPCDVDNIKKFINKQMRKDNIKQVIAQYIDKLPHNEREFLGLVNEIKI